MITYSVFRGEDVSEEEMSFVISLLTHENLDRPADAVTFVFSTIFSKKNKMGGRVIVVCDDETEDMQVIDLDEVDSKSHTKH